MDMSKYKALFVSETQEHLSSMNRGLVNIEQNPADDEAISEVFRNAHSIKGMAASMGFDPVRDLAHAMEDLMEDIRDGLRKAEPEAMDLLFKGLDTLETMLSEIQNEQEPSPRGRELAMEIRKLRGEDVSAMTEEHPAEEPEEEKKELEDTDRQPQQAPETPLSRLAPERREDEMEFILGEDSPVEKQEQETKRLGHAHPDVDFVMEEAPSEPLEEKASEDQEPPPDEEAVSMKPPPRPPSIPARQEEEESQSQEVHEQSLEELEEEEEAPAPRPAAALAPDWTVRVVFSPQTASPAVRGLILFKRVVELGEIVDSRPSADLVKAGNFMADPKGLAVEIDLASPADHDEIIKVLNSMADVQSFEVKKPSEQPELLGPPPETTPPAEQDRGQGVITEQGRLEHTYDPFAQVQALPQTVRVKTSALDKFINALGEMILVKNELREVAKKSAVAGLDQGLDRLDSLVKDFHDQVMSIRMMPLESVVQRLPRVVRDLAKEEGKKVRLEVVGQDIELDRAIIEQLTDPLIHLLRNAVNHGIEPPAERAAAGKPEEARVVLEAYRLRDLVLIEVRDDGRGIDPFSIKEAAVGKGIISAAQAEGLSDEDALQLIFQPGFSTAREVGLISGRGVGMDAVKNTVENMGGYVTLDTAVGRGATFTLHLPKTIAIVNMLLVRLAREIFAIPISKILKTVEILPHQVRRSRGTNFFLDRQELVPMKPLHPFLDLPQPEEKDRKPAPALLVESHAKKVALLVDELVGQEEAFIRPLGKPLEKISGLSGVTMLGDGRVVFVLDTMGLM